MFKMKKLVTIVILLQLFIICNCQNPPRCLSYAEDDNDEVNKNWYIYQLPKEKGLFYWDSITDTVRNKAEERHSIRLDSGSPFLRTFNQIVNDVNNKFQYVTYNDQPSGKNDHFGAPKGGHTKGFFIWNEFGGIHVMHSIPDFPVYTSVGEIFGENLKPGQFTWRTSDKFIPENVRSGGRNLAGLHAFQHHSRSNREAKPFAKQQAQYAYCTTLSSYEVVHAKFVYRHLIMTNAVIGIVNGLEVRRSLSDLEVNKLKVSQYLFNRVDLSNKKDFNEGFETRNKECYNPGENQVTESDFRICYYIDLHTFAKLPNTFPLYILAKHAYYFIRYSKEQHYASGETLKAKGYPLLDSTVDILYFYQRDNHIPYTLQVQDGKEVKVVAKPNSVNLLEKNIWDYIIEWHVDLGDEGGVIPALGGIYIQTQHYYDSNKGYAIAPGDRAWPIGNLRFDNLPFITRELDHSKQAYSAQIPGYDNGGYNWFCVGDNNYMDQQSLRGGSIHCFRSTVLAEFFSHKVVSFQHLVQGNIIETVNHNEQIKQYLNGILEGLYEPFVLSEYLNTHENNLFPPSRLKEAQLWIKIEDKVPVEILKINLPIVADSLSFKFDNFQFCYLPNYIAPIITNCQDTKCNEIFPLTADFLCSKVIKTMQLFVSHPHVNIDETSLIQLPMDSPLIDNDIFNEADIHKFQEDVVIMYFINALHGYQTNENIYIHRKPFEVPPLEIVDIKSESKHMESIVSNWCGKTITIIDKNQRRRKKVRYLYGNCLDLYFFCLKLENDQDDGILLYQHYFKTIAKILDPGDYWNDVDEYYLPSDIILPDLDIFSCNMPDKVAAWQLNKPKKPHTVKIYKTQK